MPWTFSHPAAVLPLRRFTPKPLDFAALAIGSMTPDIGYSIDRFDLANFAHTLPGSFLACLPSGMIMLSIFYLFAKPVCYLFPSPHRETLLPRCPSFPLQPARWAILLFSLLLGAWTHNFWDAFTHEHGWFVARIPLLQQQAFQIGSTTVYVFLLLQELSTVAGTAILVVAYRSWLRHHRPHPLAICSPDRWRYLFWILLAAVSLLISLRAGLHYSASISLHGFLFFRSVVFRTAIYAPVVAVPLTLLSATYFYARRSDRE